MSLLITLAQVALVIYITVWVMRILWGVLITRRVMKMSKEAAE